MDRHGITDNTRAWSNQVLVRVVELSNEIEDGHYRPHGIPKALSAGSKMSTIGPMKFVVLHAQLSCDWKRGN